MKHFVPIKPQAKERPRLGRRRKAFTPEKTQVFEAALADWWKTNVGGEPHEGPVYVYIEVAKEGFWLEVLPITTRTRPVNVRGDLDNYTKSICDGLNGVAYKDDRQVEGTFVRFMS